MTAPRPLSRCKACSRSYQSHVCGDRRLCPDGSGRSFTPYVRIAKRASASFGERELEWLSSVLSGIEQRRDLRALASKVECAKVARKVQRMRAAAVPREKL